MLKIKDISLRLGQKDILQQVSLSAQPGEVLGLIGPNGAGKSTLLKVVSGLLKADHGNVQWNNIPLSQYPIHEMAQWRAVMTQSVHLSNNFSVDEVVMMGRYPYFKTLPTAIDHAEVAQNLELLGLSHFIGRRFNQLSGGEKQRVHFARVLSQLSFATGDHEPPQLLLLDEPLNNLDIKHQYQCLHVAQEFANRGHVVVMVLHDINLAMEFASSLALLKNGRMLACGPTTIVGNDQNFSECYDLEAQVHHGTYGARVDFRPLNPPLELLRHS